MQLIPAIDLLNGRCVRLLKGDFDAQTHYEAAPGELLIRYRKLGAGWLHVVDLNGARGDADYDNRAIIHTLAGQGIRLQVGGGLRDRAAVENLLAAGVARAVIGSAAITNAAAVREWLAYFGGDALTLAFDIRVAPDGTPFVSTHGWRERSSLTLWDAMELYDTAPLRHVLCTDVDRDGALSGPNVALYREAMRRYPRVQWQASGGVRDGIDLHELALVKVAGAISGKALLDGRISAAELKPFLPNA